MLDTTTCRLALAGLALGVLSVLSGAPAAAQDDPQVERARELFEGAQEAYNQGRYEEALEGFREAHRLTGESTLQYNIGLTLELLGRLERAITAYETYLRSLPEGGDREDVEARVERLRERASQSRETAGEPASEEPPEPATSPLMQAEVDTGAAAPPGSDEGGSLLWTWVAGGAAVALGVTAGILWATVQSDYSELEDRCLPGGCPDSEIDGSGIDTRVTLTNVLLVGAGVAAVAAGALFFLETGASSTEREVAVGIGPGSIVVRGEL